MRQDLLKKIEAEITESSLKEVDKNLLISVCSQFTNEDAETLAELMLGDKGFITLLADNVKLKNKIPPDNRELWGEIFKKEEEMLSSMEKEDDGFRKKD